MNAKRTPAAGATDDHLNYGMLPLRVPAKGPPPPDTPITVIVSGVGRSGTSMTAAVISALGIPMGKTQNEAVFEDKEFIAALLYFDYALMRGLINKRNGEVARWGFKFPSLQNHILPPQLQLFRNPYLIIVTRDPVATASRAALSDPDQKDAALAFYNVAQQAMDMTHFVQKANCPTLLMSYEKFVAFPTQAIDGIANFCGLTVSAAARAKALRAVEPNNTDYIKLFHNDFRGHFNGVHKGEAFGWCSQINSNDPVRVELLADGKVVANATANGLRQDLAKASIGTGHHAFIMDVSNLGFTDDTQLRVQIEGGGYVLQGSDLELKKLRREQKPL